MSLDTILVRDLAPGVKDALRLLAAQHARSMEAEARDILARAVLPADRHTPDLAFEDRCGIMLGLPDTSGIEMNLPTREVAVYPDLR
ncbi:MAG: hypothetical protein LBR27_03610 [Bifidobacteriaceae bacterium]|jgi:plasmid stability protein|nr:hypothetical protein [Bifidobacteriaceae bacterium]